MIVDLVEGQTSIHTVREPLINRSARIAEFSAESQPLKVVRHPYPRDGDLTKRRVFAPAVGVGRGRRSLPQISANVEIAIQASSLSTTPVMKIDNVGSLPYHFPLPAFLTVLRYERSQSRVSTPRFHLPHRERHRSTSIASTLESTGEADLVNRFGTRLRLDLTHTPSLTLRNSTRAKAKARMGNDWQVGRGYGRLTTEMKSTPSKQTIPVCGLKPKSRWKILSLWNVGGHYVAVDCQWR